MKLLFTFILLSSICFGQSKKDQIESLNGTIDSLKIVLTTTRDNSVKDISSLNDKIKEILDEVTALKGELTTLQASNTKLTTENDKLKTDLGELSKKNLELEAKLKAILVEKTSFKTVKIGNLEVMTKDLGKMEWDDAKRACADLGDGWRLPTRNELNILYINKDKIGGFEDYGGWSSADIENYLNGPVYTTDFGYWSSTEYEEDSYAVWGRLFSDGDDRDDFLKDTDYFVRAVRTF
jgi:regulator of replication initiation timing